jgi:hypothetical protein
MHTSNSLASSFQSSTHLLFFQSLLQERPEFSSQSYVTFAEPVQVRRLMCSMRQQLYVCIRLKEASVMYTIVASTPDTAARTTVDDHAPSKRFEGATTVVFGAME